MRRDYYQDALEALTRADQLDAAGQTGSAPATLAFLAMTEYKLEHKERAATLLTLLRAAMNQPKWAKDDEAQAFFHEAETLLTEKERTQTK